MSVENKTTTERAKAAGAKLPADHLAEAETTNGEVTVDHDGFTFTFNPRAVTDFRLQRRLNRQEPAALDELLSIVFGDQEEAVIDHLAGADGFTDTNDVLGFLNGVTEAAGLGKH